MWLGGLDISMHDFVLVSCCQSIGYLDGYERFTKKTLLFARLDGSRRKELDRHLGAGTVSFRRDSAEQNAVSTVPFPHSSSTAGNNKGTSSRRNQTK